MATAGNKRISDRSSKNSSQSPTATINRIISGRYPDLKVQTFESATTIKISGYYP